MSQNTNFERDSTARAGPAAHNPALDYDDHDTTTSRARTNSQAGANGQLYTTRGPGAGPGDVSRSTASPNTSNMPNDARSQGPNNSAPTGGQPGKQAWYNGAGYLGYGAFPAAASHGGAPMQFSYGAPPMSGAPDPPHGTPYAPSAPRNYTAPQAAASASAEHHTPTLRANTGEAVSSRQSRPVARDENVAPARATRADGQPSQQRTKEKTESRRGGRAPGQKNFSQAETDLLFEILEIYLPLGNEAWALICREYNRLAAQRGLPSRDVAQLKTRFKRLVREAGGKKPTGESYKAKNLRRAYDIDWDIREKYGAGILDDGKLGEAGDISDDDIDSDGDGAGSVDMDNEGNIEIIKPPASKKTTSTFTVEKRHRVENSLDVKPRGRSAVAMNAITNLSAAFDPERLERRDAAKAEQNAMLVHLASGQAEIRRLQGEMDRLRDELARVRAAHADDRLKWEQEKFDLKLQAIVQAQSGRGRSRRRRRRHHRPRSSSSPDGSRSRSASSSISPPRKRPRTAVEAATDAQGDGN